MPFFVTLILDNFLLGVCHMRGFCFGSSCLRIKFMHTSLNYFINLLALVVLLSWPPLYASAFDTTQ